MLIIFSCAYGHLWLSWEKSIQVACSFLNQVLFLLLYVLNISPLLISPVLCTFSSVFSLGICWRAGKFRFTSTLCFVHFALNHHHSHFTVSLSVFSLRTIGYRMFLEEQVSWCCCWVMEPSYIHLTVSQNMVFHLTICKEFQNIGIWIRFSE